MKKTLLSITASLFSLLSIAQMSNYSFSASSGTFTDITGGTNISSIQVDDGTSSILAIGFTFNYCGVDYTKFKANSNGWITFDTLATPAGYNQRANNLSGNTSHRPILAPLWDDISGVNGTASYITTGTSPNRVLTVEWKNYKWNWLATSASISFQVKLYEGSNNIEFVYRPESANVYSGSASVGITDTASGSGNFLSLSSLASNATVSSTSETTNISAKPASGQTFTFSRCNASMPALGRVCANRGQLNLTQGSGTPTGGTGSYYVNGMSSTTFNPSTIGSGNHTIMFVYTVSGCSDTNNQTVTVDSVTPISFNVPPSICSNVDTVELIGMPNGGSYSGLGLVQGTNKLVPKNVGLPGNKFVTYSFTNAFNCSDSITRNYTLDTISKSSVTLPTAVCANAPQFTVNTGYPSGGTYFGTKVNGNVYQPNVVGTDTVYYIYQNGANSCSDTSFATITVNAAPIINFGNIGRYCQNNPPIRLNSALPKGGIYKGANVVDSTYTPSNPGIDTVYYVITNADNCSDSSFQTVQIDSVTPTSQPSIGPFCDNSPSVSLSGATPAGGTYLGRGVSGTTYDPNVAGAGFDTLMYVFTNAFVCIDTSVQTVTVNSSPTVSYATPIEVCEQDPKLTLTGGLPIGGTYSGLGVSNGEFDAGAAGKGMHSVKYVFTNGSNCTDSASVMATVNENPVFSLGADLEICGESEAELDAGIDSVSYAWSNGETTRKITIQESAVFTVTVTDTANGCISSDEIRVEYDAICVSIDEALANEVSAIYFPNPTLGALNIKLKGVISQELNIQVIGINGKVVVEEDIYYNSNDVVQIDISTINAGIYFVRLSTEKGSMIHQVRKH